MVEERCVWPFAHHLKVKGHRCVTRHESQQQSSDRLVTDSESQGPRGPRRLPTSGYFPNSQLPNGGPKPPTKNQSESWSLLLSYPPIGPMVVLPLQVTTGFPLTSRLRLFESDPTEFIASSSSSSSSASATCMLNQTRLWWWPSFGWKSCVVQQLVLTVLRLGVCRGPMPLMCSAK